MIDGSLKITHTRAHRSQCADEYYLACLELAQSLYLCGRPAQAILQLDKAMMAILAANSELTQQYPIPYSAMRWIMEHSADSGFLGNPVRHFQHLASRMNRNQPQPELRIARAWCCLHLAEAVLSSEQFPRDIRQIDTESLCIPTVDQAITALKRTSPHDDEVNWFNQSRLPNVIE